MAQDVQPSQSRNTESLSPRRLTRLGWAGIVFLPIALGVYLLALPFFALFWVIEWALPLHPTEPDPIAGKGFPSRAEEPGR